MTNRRHKSCGRYTRLTYKAGYVGNPLLSGERNKPCVCGSDKKFKKCCLPRIPKAIPESVRGDMHRNPEDKVNIFWEWYLVEQKKWEQEQRDKEAVTLEPEDVSGVTEIAPDYLDDIYRE